MKYFYQNYSILPELRPFVDLIYDYYSPCASPGDDLKQLIPFGKISFVFPYYGFYQTKIEKKIYNHTVSSVGLSGQSLKPTYVDFQSGVGLLGVALNSSTAYRLFRIPLNEINFHADAREVIGSEIRHWGERIAEFKSSGQRAAFLQECLLDLLKHNRPVKPMVEIASQIIFKNSGVVRIKDLSRSLGFSRGYLEREFLTHIGITPKDYASIIRFHKVYKHVLNDYDGFMKKGLLYEYYHDQAHFIRDFTKFTDLTPGRYSVVKNDFGREGISIFSKS